jgi:hypothetical protein
MTKVLWIRIARPAGDEEIPPCNRILWEMRTKHYAQKALLRGEIRRSFNEPGKGDKKHDELLEHGDRDNLGSWDLRPKNSETHKLHSANQGNRDEMPANRG